MSGNNINNFNGRVFFEESYPQYNLYEEFDSNTNGDESFVEKSLSSMMEKTPLSSVFFSKTNLDKIQNRIIQEVRLRGYHIGRQDDTQVQIIQRSIYLSYSKNLYHNINEQVINLNNKVINDSVPKIVSEVKQYLMYIKDITSPRDIMSHPVNVNSGNKSFPLFNF